MPLINFADLTAKLLEWNKCLTTQRDEKGSTPLHFATSVLRPRNVLRPWKAKSPMEIIFTQVFQANTAALYLPDLDGLFPIHVAASIGAINAISIFVDRYPSSAGLRDAKGRTFLHVAVEQGKFRVVSYACLTKSLAWILNMQDIDGNTALHQAVEAGSIFVFSALLRNQNINVNLTNAEGQTPLDISLHKIPPGMKYMLVMNLSFPKNTVFLERTKQNIAVSFFLLLNLAFAELWNVDTQGTENF